MKDNSVDALILNITEVVLHTHFYYITDKDLQQDLMQEGYLKAYELLSSGNYDPYRNLRTFIYTGVRNAMTNYMYHQKKESHTDIDTIDSGSWQNYKQVCEDDYFEQKIFYYDDDSYNIYEIETKVIESVCNDFKIFGDYTENTKKYFKEIGMYNKTSKGIEKEEINELVFDAIKAKVIWKLFKES